MPGVDEAAIRAAIDAGVRAALAALSEPEVVDEYPDYDEYGGQPVAVAPAPVVDDDEDEEITDAGGFGDVIPMATTNAAVGAFTPDQSWLAAQWAREPEYVRNAQPHPHFLDMWASV